MILDYTDFVELACEESDGCYHSYPSMADVMRTAPRYIDPTERPQSPQAITNDEQLLAIDRWMDFTCGRWRTFGEEQRCPHCPHCQTTIESVTMPSHLPAGMLQAVDLSRCHNCGWWDLEEQVTVRQDDGGRHYEAPSVHRRAVLRQFDVAGADVPIASLRDYLTRHPHALSYISPYSLEKLVAKVFGETMNCEAIHVGGPNDGGIDVVLVQGDRRYVVQTKRRGGTAAESVSGIREFVGAMVVADEMKGIFVTTAPKFSDSAVTTAEMAVNRKAVEYIELVASGKLIDVCKLAAESDEAQWNKVKSLLTDLHQHTQPGFTLFMDMFMGSADWKMARQEERRRVPKQRHQLRYFQRLGDPEGGRE